MKREQGIGDVHYFSRVRSEVEQLLAPPYGPLLDVGGGTGATAAALKQRYAIERAGVIDFAVQGDAFDKSLDFALTGDLERSDVLERAAADAGPFGTVLCLDVLEHLVDPWAVVKRIHGLLAPGGSLVISVPNVSYLPVVARLALRGSWTLQDDGILDRTHLRFFVKDTAIELATCSGLELEALETTHPGPSSAVYWVRKLCLGHPRRFFAFQYLLRVRRVD